MEEEIISSIAGRLRNAEDIEKETEKIILELKKIKEIMESVSPEKKDDSPTPLEIINERLRAKLKKLKERGAK